MWWQDQLTDNRGFQPQEVKQKLGKADIVYLRASITYGTSRTQFFYSTDNKTFLPLGQSTTLGYNLSIFVGARYGLFCYNRRKDSNGYADFDWFSTEDHFEETDYYPVSSK